MVLMIVFFIKKFAILYSQRPPIFSLCFFIKNLTPNSFYLVFTLIKTLSQYLMKKIKKKALK